MNARGVTLEQLADALGYEVRIQNKHKYIRMNYTGYFRSGIYHNIIVQKEKDEFKVHVHINIPKASTQEMVIEQNGVKIVIEQQIEDAINSILKAKDMTKKYILIGKEENGVFYGDSTKNGVVYKSEDAYLNRHDEICYIPEYGFPEENNFCGTEDVVDGYTRNNLMELCDGNKKLCDCLFYGLDWQSPETLLNEIDEEEF
jgi:hypothetical protein